MDKIEQRVREIAGYVDFPSRAWDDQTDETHREVFNDHVTCYKQGIIDTLNKVEEFLNKNLENDHCDSTTGFACMFPDVILCPNHFHVNEFIKDLKEYVNKVD